VADGGNPHTHPHNKVPVVVRRTTTTSVFFVLSLYSYCYISIVAAGSPLKDGYSCVFCIVVV